MENIGEVAKCCNRLLRDESILWGLINIEGLDYYLSIMNDLEVQDRLEGVEVAWGVYVLLYRQILGFLLSGEKGELERIREEYGFDVMKLMFFCNKYVMNKT